MALAERKAVVVAHQVAQIPGDYALIVGDSIVERARIDELCGLPVVTAGVSGSTLPELKPLLKKLAELREPRITVLAAGINGFRMPGNGKASEWKNNLRASVDVLGTIDAMIEMIESDSVDQDAVRHANAITREFAETRKMIAIPAIPAELTVDGVHPSPEGYTLWRENLRKSLEARA